MEFLQCAIRARGRTASPARIMIRDDQGCSGMLLDAGISQIHALPSTTRNSSIQ